jgi:hypothetical protein
MAFVPIAVASTLGIYALTQAQANITAKQQYKNTVIGGDRSQWSTNYTPGEGPERLSPAQIAELYTNAEKLRQKNVNKATLPLNAIDNINTAIHDHFTKTKIRRKDVPTIPGVTKVLPYTTIGLNNNPSQF